MSLETAITELNATMLANIAAMKILGENQERLIAGQAAAIDKVEAPKATRKKAADPVVAAKADEPAAVVEQQMSVLPDVSDADLKVVANDYLQGQMKKGEAELKVGQAFVKSIIDEFNCVRLCGPESTADAEQRAKASFYIRRKAAGLSVDFGADYDFAGDPTQGGAADDEFEV